MSVAAAGASLLVFAAGTAAQEPDRAARNREAVRRAFPIVGLFDRKAPKVDAADASRTPQSSVSSSDTSAEARLGRSEAVAARFVAMRVAGVGLGMTPDSARAALKASGYSPMPQYGYTDRRPQVERGYDYPARVDRARRERLADAGTSRQSMTITAEYWHKDDERVHVRYAPVREGVRVSSVAYSIPAGRIDWRTMRSSVLARYGRPTRLADDQQTARWCGDDVCNVVGPRFAELVLSDRWRLELNDGGAFERLSSEQALADANASIRKADKPSF